MPAADGKLRLWRNTAVAALARGPDRDPAGETRSATSGTRTLDNGARPPGLVRLSSTTRSGVEVLQDYGSTYGSGTATHT